MPMTLYSDKLTEDWKVPQPQACYSLQYSTTVTVKICTMCAVLQN